MTRKKLGVYWLAASLIDFLLAKSANDWLCACGIITLVVGITLSVSGDAEPRP
jgi:hypothetical protein